MSLPCAIARKKMPDAGSYCKVIICRPIQRHDNNNALRVMEEVFYSSKNNYWYDRKLKYWNKTISE